VTSGNVNEKWYLHKQTVTHLLSLMALLRDRLAIKNTDIHLVFMATFPVYTCSHNMFRNRTTINPLKPALTISKSAFFIYVFRMILSVNRDYVLEQHQQTYFCKCEVWCFFCSMD
jgi:hypothetical protein